MWGFGGASVKSLALFRVSVHPFAARVAAFVLPAAGAGAVPRKQFAVLPYPTKSTMLESVGHAPVNGVAVLTSATLPDPAAIAIAPTASGVGSVAPLFPPAS